MIFSRKIKFIIPVILSVIFFFNIAQAQIDQAQKELKSIGSVAYGVEDAKVPNSPEEIIGEIIKYILSFLGIIFLILILYSGFLWMTAGGETEQIKKAQGILKNAAIGLLIVLSAYIITYFVMNKLIATTGYK